MLTKKISSFILFFLLLGFGLFAQEDCSNGIDDDGDGLIDLNDFIDCPCTFNPNIGSVTSLIENPSFEDFAICPTVPNQLNEADSWNQMTNGGPDYFNTCSPFSAIVPLPFPDGEGVAGFAASNGFLEYIGAPLTSPLVAGEDYRLDFDVAAAHLDGTVQNAVGPPIASNIELTLYGNLSTTNFPISTTTGLTPPAPASTWVVLGTVDYSPSDTWTNQSILFTAGDNYEMIAFGPPIGLPFDYINANDLPYFFVDQFILNLESSFGATLSLTGELCLDNSFIAGVVPDPTTQWYFNNEAIVGQTTDDLDVSALGLGAGDYSLSIISGAGCEFASISVLDNDYPELIYAISDLCPPGDVTFTSNSIINSGIIDSTVWQLQSTYSTETATEAYNTPGNYNITLSAFSELGCRTDSSFSISVEAPPIASFSFNPGCVGQPILFTDESTAGAGIIISTFNWDFGDMTNSSLQNPDHTYSDVLSYDVLLTVSTAAGCADDTTLTVSSFPTPVPEFSSTTACVEQSATVFNNLSTISTGTITDVSWDFGDSNTAGNINAPSNNYSASGEYNATLTATSDHGCINSITNTVSVSDITASINADQWTGCSPHCVQFDDASTSDLGAIYNWEWNASNGLSSSLVNPNICFNNPSNDTDAIYDIQLIVENEYGCIDSITLSSAIISGYTPVADFNYSPTEITSIDPTIHLSNLSQGADTYLWEFGEEGVSTDFEPTYTFENNGTTEITLVISTSAGCIDSTSRFINILPIQTIYVPNTFTPDEDGLNDLFFPIINGASIDLYEFEIYDRYGHALFRTEDPEEKWNGDYSLNNKFYIADGTYSWRMKIRFNGDTNVQIKTGTLTALR